MSAAAHELIRSLEERGIYLEVVEDRLRVDAPKGSLTPELREMLTQKKPELVSALKADWADDARKLIDALPDESLRVLMHDFYEESAATLEYEQGLSREAAERSTFGLLVFQLLRRGIEVGVSQ